MVESVSHVTYARVAKDATPSSARQRPHTVELDRFFLEHVAALRKLAAGVKSSPANFLDPGAEALFTNLRTGSEAEFLDAAHRLTLRLIARMDGRTDPGLLVCIRIEDGTSKSAAVLKLQVVTPNAANLETLDSGEELLSAVTDVMDAPGKLQKGVLVPDPRPDSDVIVGDVAAKEAQYFPRAFDVSIQQRPRLAAADTLEAIRELQGDDVELAARRVMPTIPSGPVAQVLEQLGETVPELGLPEVRRAVQDLLASRPRPVRDVDTSAPLTEVITASGITITAPVTAHDRVTWVADTNQGGYVVTIRVDEEPQREVR